MSKMRTVRPKRMSEMYDGPAKMDEPIYPRLSLPLTALPEAKSWKIGETYDIELRVKQVSVYENKSNGEVSFDIIKIGVDDDADEANEE